MAQHKGAYTVTTNHHWRTTLTWYDLPADAQSNFDYLEGEDRAASRFVKFRDDYVDTGEGFEIAPSDLAFLGWSVACPTSFFDGLVLCHFDTDGNFVDDAVKVGHFTV